MPVRKAQAVWNGGLKGGTGTMRTETGSFEGPYSAGSRFAEDAGTNPEELLAAAHAGCLAMALSGGLERAGHAGTQVTVSAACTIEKLDAGFRVTRMKLTVRGTVPGMSAEAFAEAAEAAKNGCPISNALMNNVAFELDAALV